MVYRGFYVLKHHTHGTYYGYIDRGASENLNASVSLTDLADYFYNVYPTREDADPKLVELYKANRMILRILSFKESTIAVSGSGADVEALTDGSYKLPADANIAAYDSLSTVQPFDANRLDLTVKAFTEGIYKITAKVNRENAFVERIALRANNNNSYVSAYTLGKSSDLINTENVDYLAADAVEEVVGYIYLPAGNNTVTLASSAVIGISGIKIEPVGLPIADLCLCCRKYDPRRI